MSGGHFDHKQYQISDIADEIDNIVRNNMDESKNEWGNTRGRHYDPVVIAHFKEAIKTLNEACVMVQRIDWLLSGDDGEENFLRRWDEDLKKLKENE